MAIQTQSFSTIVGNAVAAIQGAASQLVDLTIGSVLRVFVESNAMITLWLQGLALQIAALTRFSTSTGSDADSWAADYGFLRLPATAASGQVTFARFTATAQATIPVGTLVQTADGSQQYSVIADTTQSAYNAGINAYVIPASTSSIAATVQAVAGGSAGNAGAGIINTMGSSISGVDTVTNASPFANGADAEPDAAYRTRFIQYIASLPEGTPTAIINAVKNLQQGAAAYLTENMNTSGAYQAGYFYVVVDDGTGSPSGTFLANATAAINKVRPVGESNFGVFAPSIVTANVAMTVAAGAGYLHSTIAPLVQSAITSYINSLPIAGTLPFSRLAQVAYDASPGVVNVTAVTLNSATADITASSQQLIKAGTVTIS